jgi:thiol-disulfide isomerase/thioredoxin
MMKKTIFFLFLFSILFRAFSQTAASNKTYPVTGQIVPYFELKDVRNSELKAITRENLKGQAVILEFWGKRCLSCIRSFPKINELQKKFKGKVKIILVSPDDDETKNVFKKYSDVWNLNLTTAYSTPLFLSWKIGGLPQNFWLDRNGTVQLIGGLPDLNEKNISGLINDMPIKPLFDRSYDNEVLSTSLYDPSQPLFVDGNGGELNDVFEYRSLLVKWHSGMGVGSNAWRFKDTISRYDNLRTTRRTLFMLAYLGNSFFPEDQNFYRTIVADIKDSLLFKSRPIDKQYYCYSLIIPKSKANRQYFMLCMQEDLKRYFGYAAKIEERMLPCLYLVKTGNTDKLVSTDEKKSLKSSKISFECHKYPVSDAFKLIAGYFTTLNVYNKTGIEGDITLDIKAVMSDMPSVNTELQKYGVQLVLGENNQQALVIQKTDSVVQN